MPEVHIDTVVQRAGTLDVLIIGAGPAGLAAAIAAQARGLSYVVLEKAALVNSLMHYPTDMVFFTTPELMEIGELPFVSPHDRTGDIAARARATRQEALRYYRRVTDRFKLDVRLGERVTGLTRTADGSFTVTSVRGEGDTYERTAASVVIAKMLASETAPTRRRLKPQVAFCLSCGLAPQTVFRLVGP